MEVIGHKELQADLEKVYMRRAGPDHGLRFLPPIDIEGDDDAIFQINVFFHF